MTARGSLAFVGAFTAYWLVALPLNSASSTSQQLVLSLSAWVFFAVALALQSPAVRIQVITLVYVATVLEIVGSIVWGAYRYRLGNLLLFVPAAMGSSISRRCARLRSRSCSATPGASSSRSPLLRRSTCCGGLVRPPLPDLLGFVTWAVFIRFIVCGRFPRLYAVSFVLTMALELYGTGWGSWRGSPVVRVCSSPPVTRPPGSGPATPRWTA